MIVMGKKEFFNCHILQLWLFHLSGPPSPQASLVLPGSRTSLRLIISAALQSYSGDFLQVLHCPACWSSLCLHSTSRWWLVVKADRSSWVEFVTARQSDQSVVLRMWSHLSSTSNSSSCVNICPQWSHWCCVNSQPHPTHLQLVSPEPLSVGSLGKKTV